MDSNKQNILLHSLMCLSTASLANSRTVFKFETTSIHIGSRLPKMLKEVLTDREGLKQSFSEKFLLLDQRSNLVKDYLRKLKTLLYLNKGGMNSQNTIKSPFVESLYYLKSLKEDLSQILISLISASTKMKQLIMDLEPKTKLILSLVETLKSMLIIRQVAQKDFKK
jgi:hypothetical protein